MTPTPLQKKLKEAIQKDELSTVIYLINDIDKELLDSALDEDGYYAIHIAAEHGFYGILKYLLEMKPALLDQTTVYNYTPIMLAVYYGSQDYRPPALPNYAQSVFDSIKSMFPNVSHYIPVIEELRSRGADLTKKVNHLDEKYHNYSVYELAYHPTIRALLPSRPFSQKEMDRSFTDACQFIKWGDTKRFISILKRHPNLVNYIQNDNTLLSLAIATVKDRHANVEFIFTRSNYKQIKINIDLINHSFQKLLKQLDKKESITYEDIIIAKNLINNGADINIRLESGQFLIHLVIQKYGSWSLFEDPLLDFVRLILDKNRNMLNQTDREGVTPLMLAVSKHHLTIITYLLDTGADQLLHTNELHPNPGYAAIHFAACSSTIVEQLVTQNPEVVHLEDNSGRTPLFFAGLDSIRYLISCTKVNIDARVSDRSDPYYGCNALEQLQSMYAQFEISDQSSSKNEISLQLEFLIKAGRNNKPLRHRQSVRPSFFPQIQEVKEEVKEEEQIAPMYFI